MTCEWNREKRENLLLAAGSDNLDPEASLHVRNCEACAAAIAAQKALWSALDQWTVPDVSPAFDARLYAKIEARNQESWPQRLSRFLLPAIRKPAFGLTAAVVVCAAGFVIDYSARPLNPAGPRSSVNRVTQKEAEQLERTLDDIEVLRQFDLKGEEKEAASKSM